MLVNIGYIILVLISLIIPFKYILMMYQQNRYENERYNKWYKENNKNVPFLLMIIFFITSNNILYIAIILICKIILDYIKESKKQYIKPLVITNRVKRQILVIILIYILILSIICYFRLYSFGVVISLCINNELLINLVGIITNPIEKYFQNKFKVNAQRKLLTNTNLVRIGITGSYGKTSSKNIIQEVISNNYYSLMTPESYNTPMGICRTINEHLDSLHQVFVCEMGADHVGDIVELMEFVKPSIGIVTSIGPQHLQTFKTLDNIINEKMQEIEMLPENGLGIINNDNEYIRNYKIKNKVNIVSIGIDNDATYKAINIKYTNQGTTFDVIYDNNTYKFETRLLGKHNISNILVSIAIANHLNVDFNDIIKAVKRCPYVKHRLELKKINGYTFIDNAFNSNPQGANMSLDVLSMMNNKRFIITPGMIDLGEIQDKCNYEFGLYMKDKVDIVILVGIKQTKHIYQGLIDSNFNMDNVIVKETVKQAFDTVYTLATTNDTILLENDLPDAFNN